MEQRDKKGKLIIIEAGDGCGKATQTELLYQYLMSTGQPVRKVSFPNYKSESSALVKMYLRGEFGTDPMAVNPYVSSAFFAVDRFASYRTEWEGFYQSGGIVLADRYTTSNMVHQAVKIQDKEERSAFLKWLWDFEFRLFGLPVPDCVFFLDVPPQISLQMLKERQEELRCQADRDIHEQDPEYLAHCYQVYSEVADTYGWKRVQCVERGKLLSIEAIHGNVRQILENVLAVVK